MKTLDNGFFTRWNLRLNFMEKYVALEPYLQLVLQTNKNAPKLLSKAKCEVVAECIHVLRGARMVERCHEADRKVAGSKLPGLSFELNDTLDLYSGSRLHRPSVQH